MKSALRVLACLSLILVLTSCSSAAIHGTSKSPDSVSPQIATPTHSATPPVTAPKVPQVVKKWTVGQFQDGIQLYWHFPASPKAIEAKAASDLDYIVELGANSVAISFPIYTDGMYPTHVYAEADTPTTAQLSLVIKAAQARGLRVTIRPIINEANITAMNPNGWRGNIEPPNVSTWFASYDQFMMPYVVLAQQDDIAEFVTGTELLSLEGYTSLWQRLIQQESAVFKGQISYASNYNERPNPAFQTLGTDAYPPVNVSDSASWQVLSQNIGAWLNQQPLSVRQRLTIQEVGIPARPGVYPHPWEWVQSNTALSKAEISTGNNNQANWFKAMCSAAHNAQLNGVYYWAIDTNVDMSTVNPSNEYMGGFVGRPAAQAIKTCFVS